eukprot:2786610-Rhodomonas_salina.2
MTCLPRRRSPLTDVDPCYKNYCYIASVIASFSAQLSSKCRCSFPRVFESIDLQTSPHLLTGLCEFVSMYHQYEHGLNTVKAESDLWVEAFQALHRPMASEMQAICDWINAIDCTVKDLNLAKVNPHSIDGALCGNVISLVRAQGQRTYCHTLDYEVSYLAQEQQSKRV